MADILSQEEIDALLQVVDDDGDSQSSDSSERNLEEPKQVVIYDFKRPDKFSKETLLSTLYKYIPLEFLPEEYK